MRTLRHELPLLNALAVFEQAARHCNNTLAAQALGIAQSAVSRHISNLEAHTGLTLFDRRGNRLVLTADGQRLAEAVSGGLGQIRDAIVMMQRQNRARPYTIACSYDIASLWLMPRFNTIRTILGQRELRLMTADSYINFDDPEVDLSIRYGDGRWGDLTAIKLVDEEIFPICSPRLLKERPELMSEDKAALLTAPLLHLSRETQVFGTWNNWFKDLGIELDEEKGTVFSSYNMMLQEVIAGYGVGLGWTKMVDSHIAAKQIVRLSSDSIVTGNAFYAVFPSGDTDKKTAEIVAYLMDNTPAASA